MKPERMTARELFACNTAHTLRLADGQAVPRLGQGTWHMGEDVRDAHREEKALRLGLELGMTLIDTAEMYAEGGAEQVVGSALRGQRGQAFLVSKVYPYNARMPALQKSCETTLRRLGAAYLDLYLLHWRGGIPLEQTVEGMESLVRQGKILRWGVSNFDVRDMEQLFAVPGGGRCAVDQVLYHLGSRGVEYDLLPWLRAHGVVPMAYCPIAQAGRLRQELTTQPDVLRVARAHDATPQQVLLAWCLAKDVFAIPKAANEAHVRENAVAGALELDEGEIRSLEEAFPASAHKVPLDVQ